MAKSVRCKYKGCEGCNPEECTGVNGCKAYKKASNQSSPSYKQPERSIVATLCNHRLNGYDVQVTVEEVKEVYDRTTTCRYCKRTMQRSSGTHSALSPSLDRINNEHTITKDNIQYICRECNTRKGDRTHDEYIAYAKRVLELNPE